MRTPSGTILHAASTTCGFKGSVTTSLDTWTFVTSLGPFSGCRKARCSPCQKYTTQDCSQAGHPQTCAAPCTCSKAILRTPEMGLSTKQPSAVSVCCSCAVSGSSHSDSIAASLRAPKSCGVTAQQNTIAAQQRTKTQVLGPPTAISLTCSPGPGYLGRQWCLPPCRWHSGCRRLAQQRQRLPTPGASCPPHGAPPA